MCGSGFTRGRGDYHGIRYDDFGAADGAAGVENHALVLRWSTVDDVVTASRR
jgi:hypothetical protein